jgi:hypothetical protein
MPDVNHAEGGEHYIHGILSHASHAERVQDNKSFARRGIGTTSRQIIEVDAVESKLFKTVCVAQKGL